MRTIITLLLTLAGLICAIASMAQQRPQYSQYMHNRYGSNIAFAGFDRSLSITAGLRSQWTDLDNAPRSQFINAHLPLYFLNGSAGLSMESHQIGISDMVDISGSFNYIQEIPVGIISVGARLGVRQITTDGSEIRTPDGNYQDGAVVHNDPILSSTKLDQYNMIWGIGAMFAMGDMEVSVAIDQFPDAQVAFSGSYYTLSSQFTLYGAYQIAVSDMIMVKPSLQVRYDGAQLQTDIGANSYYDRFFWGVGLRGYSGETIDALTIIGGVQLSPKMRVSYSYDVGLSSFSPYHSGTHEFVINYNLNRRINTGDYPPIIYNPRYH